MNLSNEGFVPFVGGPKDGDRHALDSNDVRVHEDAPGLSGRLKETRYLLHVVAGEKLKYGFLAPDTMSTDLALGTLLEGYGRQE